jgi:hypothetical protein
MRPILVLLLLPVAIGMVSFALLRNVRKASFAATLLSPALIFCLVKFIEPGDAWSALATFLVSPLVIAIGVVTVFIFSGRAPERKHRGRHHA